MGKCKHKWKYDRYVEDYVNHNWYKVYVCDKCGRKKWVLDLKCGIKKRVEVRP